MDFYRRTLALAGTTQTKWFSLLLLTADSILCGLIIWKVPCTWVPGDMAADNEADGMVGNRYGD